MDKNLSKLVKVLILGQIVLTAMFHLEKAFVFWRLINKNSLKWFLLVICDELQTFQEKPFHIVLFD